MRIFLRSCGDASQDIMFCPMAAQREVKMKDAFRSDKVLLQPCDWLILYGITLLPPTNHNHHLNSATTNVKALAM